MTNSDLVNRVSVVGNRKFKDQAFAWLNKAVAGRSHWLVWLNRDPRWDRLRPDPRFDDLKKRVGLPQS
jgi:hypothetical protein